LTYNEKMGLTKQGLINTWQKRGLISNQTVLEAFRMIPREKFVPSGFESEAYCDAPLKIGCGQTISQPFTVLAMIELLNVAKTDKVLEIGAGSGYGAAILGQLASQVYAIEIVSELVKLAQGNLNQAKINNVEVIEWDGSRGYDRESPYDRIIVSAACSKIPRALIEQLGEGGIIVAPVGGSRSQVMTRGVKCKGSLQKSYFGNYVFVPLTGKFGQTKD
jgi:protein-L-isoaspartate(D-aspartate) O-methyltransferase